MSSTARLSLPLLQPAQAQKHVTVNEALSRLDLLAQLVLSGVGADQPPGAPAEGEVHAIGAAATGDWAGRSKGTLAAFVNGGWLFLSPGPGWRAWDRAGGMALVWTGSAWLPEGDGAAATDTLPALGIGTAADADNPLTVAAGSCLFTHDATGDHRFKINAEPAGTASLIFQSGYSGRAEIGLAGEADLSLKVSADSATWTEALRAERSSGIVSLPQGADSVQFEVPHNAVASIATPSAGGFVLLSLVDQSYPQNPANAILVYDTGTSPLLTSVWTGGSIDNLGTTVLTGTTGADGKVSVSVSGDGRLHVENRYTGGTTRQISLFFMNGFRPL